MQVVFGQNRILLFNKSATCFSYHFAGITGSIPRISKEENDMVAILARDLEPYNVLQKVYNTHNMYITKNKRGGLKCTIIKCCMLE